MQNNDIDIQELFNRGQQKDLAKRLIRDGIEPLQIQNVDTSEMYLIDRNGTWQPTTPNDIAQAIIKEGADGVDIVIQCSVHNMNSGLELDRGLVEITGVTSFEFDGATLSIENNEQFFTTDNIAHELGETMSDFGMEDYERDPNGDVAQWVENTSWDDISFDSFDFDR